MNAREKVKLLFGPYKAPRLRTGDRASCLYRDREVKIIGRTDARIPWPLCRVVGSRGAGGLLVEQKLAWAIRHESAAAVAHWWGVCGELVRRWRRAFGVERMENPGSCRLILAASEAGADQTRGVPLPAEAVERARQRNREEELWKNLRPGYQGEWWKPEDVALLGKLLDEEIAERTGRTAHAVGIKRRKLGIPSPCDRRRQECRG